MSLSAVSQYFVWVESRDFGEAGEVRGVEGEDGRNLGVQHDRDDACVVDLLSTNVVLGNELFPDIVTFE